MHPCTSMIGQLHRCAHDHAAKGAQLHAATHHTSGGRPAPAPNPPPPGGCHRWPSRPHPLGWSGAIPGAGGCWARSHCSSASKRARGVRGGCSSAVLAPAAGTQEGGAQARWPGRCTACITTQHLCLSLIASTSRRPPLSYCHWLICMDCVYSCCSMHKHQLAASAYELMRMLPETHDTPLPPPPRPKKHTQAAKALQRRRAQAEKD
jgi:hypothetical protein